MKLLSDKEIEECMYRSRNKGKVLVENVKLDYETPRSIAFTVGDKWKYSVIYKKINDNFSCTCKWFTLTAKPCAHIIAVNLWLKEKNIRKKNIK